MRFLIQALKHALEADLPIDHKLPVNSAKIPVMNQTHQQTSKRFLERYLVNPLHGNANMYF